MKLQNKEREAQKPTQNKQKKFREDEEKAPFTPL